MNAALRQFASPYARKLARERGIVLADVGGSGPAGRVIAADVLTFIKPAIAPEPVPAHVLPEASPVAVAAPTAVVAALATEIDLARLQELIEQFAGAQLALSADALLLRAAARSLAGIGIKGAIGWEAGGGAEKRETVVTNANSLSPGALQALLDGDTASSGDKGSAILSIRRLGNSGIRAVSLPLQPGHRLRLVLSGQDLGMVECLLVFDTASVDEDQAVEFLARFKGDLETPLRLLA